MNDGCTELCERIRDAAASGTPLRTRGGGTKDWYAEALCGELLDTRVHHGILTYDPAELVITARCGTPLREVEETLAACGQMLGFEPPHFAEGATIGGCIAAGLAGPRRARAGAVRDFVLGAVLLDGRGQVLRFGGEVMKNVAGYDVARLLCGSLGILGVILEISLRVTPAPPSEATLNFEADEAQALRQLSTWAGQPLPISATAWHGGELRVRLSGTETAVRVAHACLGGEALATAQAQDFWASLREQRLAFFATADESACLWRVSLPPSAPPLAFGAKPFIEWDGGLRWHVSQESPEKIRQAAAAVGGQATAFRRRRPGVATFTAPPAPLLAIHRRLKSAFDPAAILNRGRMFVGL